MSKMFYDGEVPAGESTDDMVLVYNRTDTPKSVTVDGKTIGGREKAWITWDDPVMIKGVEKEIFRIVKNKKIADPWSIEPKPIPANQENIDILPVNKEETPVIVENKDHSLNTGVKVNANTPKKRKPRKQ